MQRERVRKERKEKKRKKEKKERKKERKERIQNESKGKEQRQVWKHKQTTDLLSILDFKALIQKWQKLAVHAKVKLKHQGGVQQTKQRESVCVCTCVCMCVCMCVYVCVCVCVCVSSARGAWRAL